MNKGRHFFFFFFPYNPCCSEECCGQLQTAGSVSCLESVSGSERIGGLCGALGCLGGVLCPAKACLKTLGWCCKAGKVRDGLKRVE